MPVQLNYADLENYIGEESDWTSFLKLLSISFFYFIVWLFLNGINSIIVNFKKIKKKK